MFSFTLKDNKLYIYEIYKWTGEFYDYAYRVEKSQWTPPKQKGWRNIKPTVEILEQLLVDQYLTDEALEMIVAWKKELECEGEW
jgi:hypothetical protein